MGEIVTIAVIEGERERLPWHPTPTQALYEVFHRENGVVSADVLHPGREEGGRQRGHEWVVVVIDPMEGENRKALDPPHIPDRAAHRPEQTAPVQHAGQHPGRLRLDAHCASPCRRCQSSSISNVQSTSPW